MIKINNKEQLEIAGIESWQGLLSLKKFKILMKSWADVFRNYILPQILLNKITDFYSKSMGRPTKESYALAGAVALQQIFQMNMAIRL